MKAVVVRASGELAVETMPDPTPEPGQMVLRVGACGICSDDLHLHGAGVLDAGAVLGHEFCGEVVESAGDFDAGERVCAVPVLSCGRCKRCRSGLGAFCAGGALLGLGASPGALAEYVIVAPHEAVRLPPGVNDALGALVEPLAVALHAVNAARLQRGAHCLVIGAGPLGLAIAMWARHFGADQVVVSEGRQARRGLAERMGATRVIDPGRGSVEEALARGLPERPDVVFEAAGAPGVIQEAMDAVEFRGRVVVVGACPSSDAIQPRAAMAKEVGLRFVSAYEKDDFQYTVDMLDRERILPGPMITDRIGLEGVPEAFRSPDPDRHCKVIAVPGL
jgi:(R,R)-butanediol dehydrogenase/meso-butanediol dehydrogenase/diacetyl reductase